MSFLFSVRNDPADPAGLILTAAEARRQLARREAQRHAARRLAGHLLRAGRARQ